MTKNTNPHQFVLKASCAAKSGIVAATTTFLAERGCYISELSQFDDPDTNRFFMRAVGHIEHHVFLDDNKTVIFR